MYVNFRENLPTFEEYRARLMANAGGSLRGTYSVGGFPRYTGCDADDGFSVLSGPYYL